MASQSLYRKWRSQTFNDLVGQEAIIRTLKNALNSDKLAHAYLFTGPRGTGKTSTARLLAKTINCINPQAGEPCNECQQCREITAGNSFNVIEIDAASNRGIDSIRDLREKIMMPPSTGKYKVYVLDEAHMLTTEAFNALLKTLEEPPDYAIFVMATTDVHKMLPTVLSRCQRFDFTRITTRQIVEHLIYVAGQEQVKLERSAAELLARAAAGGMRDALSLLDQAIAYAGSDIPLVQVQQMLGVADPRSISNLIVALANQDGAAGLHQINQLSDSGADLRQINAQLIEYWRGMMLARAGANVSEILDSTEDELREMIQLAQLFSLDQLTACARIFAQNDLMQKNIGTPQLGLELAFLECLEIHRRGQSGPPHNENVAPAPVARNVQPREVHAREVREAYHAQPTRPSPITDQRPAAEPAPEQAPVEGEVVVFEPAPLPESFATESPALDSAEPFRDPAYAEPTVVVEEVAQVVPASAPAQQAALSLQQIKARWDQVKKRVRASERSSKTSGMLNDFEIANVEAEGEAVVVVLQAQHDFSYSFVNANERYKLVEGALSTEFMEQNLDFQVRLVQPGKVLPTQQQQAPLNLSLQAPAAPQSTARREPRAAPSITPPSTLPAAPATQNTQSSRPMPAPPGRREPESPPPVIELEPPASYQSGESETRANSVLPLARTPYLSENRTISSVSTGSNIPAPPATSAEPESAAGPGRQRLEQKVKGDPIVQEVMRMFSASIADIRPK